MGVSEDEEILKKLDEIEKKLDWLIEFVGLGTYNRTIKITPSTGTNEIKEGLKYFKEPSTTDGRL